MCARTYVNVQYVSRRIAYMCLTARGVVMRAVHLCLDDDDEEEEIVVTVVGGK